MAKKVQKIDTLREKVSKIIGFNIPPYKNGWDDIWNKLEETGQMDTHLYQLTGWYFLFI